MADGGNSFVGGTVTEGDGAVGGVESVLGFGTVGVGGGEGTTAELNEKRCVVG